jgi:hypothetical protein
MMAKVLFGRGAKHPADTSCKMFVLSAEPRGIRLHGLQENFETLKFCLFIYCIEMKCIVFVHLTSIYLAAG